MALEASVLTVKVQSDGIEQTTKALNDLAAAGEKAEKGTSNIGKGAAAVGQAAKDAAQAGVDAAQQAASQYNAIIDKMTEDAKAYYSAKARMEQQEVMDGAVLADKLSAMVTGYFQTRADEREKDRVATLKSQEDIMASRIEQYNKELELMNKQFDAFQANRAKQEAAAQAKGNALNAAGQQASDRAKLQADIKALKDETDKLAAAEKAEQAQRESIDMMAQKKRWQDEAAAVREATAAKVAAEKAEQQLKADGDAFTAMLKKQADTVGMSAKQIKDYNAELLRQKAAQLGVSNDVEAYIKKIQNAKGAHEGLSLATAGSTREIIVMGHELMTGNINKFWGSLVVEANRINIIPTLIKPIAAAAEALGISVGVLIGTFAAVAAVTGMAISTWVSTRTELKNLRAEVVLTGGVIGATGDQLYDMANKIGGSTGMYTEAYEAFNKLASSGKFTADQINLIATAAVGIQRVGGPAVDATIAQFERLAADPMHATVRGYTGITDAAMELNKQLNFLEPQVLAEAQHLQNMGEYAKASELLINELAKTENKRVDELRAKLTPFGAFMADLANKMKAAWHDIFHEQSDEDQLASLRKRITDISQAHGVHVQWSPEESDLLKQAAALQAKITGDKKKADDDAAARARKNADDEHLTWLNNMYRRAKGQTEADETRTQAEKAFQQLKDDGIKADVMGAEAQKTIYEYIEKSRNKKAPKVKSDGLSGITDEISKIQDAYEIQKNLIDNQIKIIESMNQKKMMTDSAASDAKAKLLEQESKLEEDTLRKELAKRDAFYSADKKLMEQNDKAKNDLKKRLTIAGQNTDTKSKINGMDDFDPKAQAAADSASKQVVDNIVKQTEAIQYKIDAYNRLPEAARKAGMTEKQMQDAITQSEIDSYNERIAAVAQMGPASNKEVQRLKAERDALVEKTKAQKDWEAIQKQNTTALNASAALTKVATEQAQMWKQTGKEIETALTNAFGNSGKAAGMMMKVFADNQANQISLADQIRVIKTKDGLDEVTRQNQIDDLNKQSAQSQIGMYGSMADAAAGFFDKQSTGYKIATSISKAFHLAETAMALASIPAKMAAGAATMFAQSGWGAFAGIAAMTAAVAAFGVAVTSHGGGPMTSADQQKIQGTGTVLGSPTITDGNKVELAGTVSQSIKNSLTVLEKNSGLGLSVQNDMLDAMRKLNDNISAFAVMVVQNGNLTGYTSPDSKSFSGGGLKGLGSAAGMGVGYAAGAGLTAFTSLASLGGPIGLLIGGALGALLPKALSSIFGGSVKVDDTGFTMGKATLGQVDQSGLNASQYTNITTSGGWFRSDKHATDMQSLGADFNNQVTMVVKGMQDTLTAAAKGLGVDGAAFNDKLQGFVVDIGNVSLKGMTGDQIQAALQGVFSKLGDQMAKFAFSDLQKYQQIGEGLLQTIARVSNDLGQVQNVFSMLGRDLPKSIESIATAEQMIKNFGSVDNLTKGIKSYVSAIYTDSEKLAPVIKDVKNVMGALGESAITTKEQFKALIESLDPTSEMFKKLIDIAPEFGQMIDGTEKAVTDARTALTDAYNKESQALQTAHDNMLNFVKTLQSLRDASLLGSLSTLTPEQKYLEAKAQFDKTAAAAQNGDATAQGNFSSAYNAFLQASQVANASGEQYQKDFAYAQKVTDDATKWAQKQVDVAQATLDALNKQVSGLITLNTTMLSVSDAIQNLLKAQGGDTGGVVASNSKAAVDSLYNSILHREADAAGEQYWLDKVMKGMSLATVANFMSASDEAKGITSPMSNPTPVTAMQHSSSAAVSDLGQVVTVLADVKNTLDDVKTAITTTGQNTIGALYDSNLAAATTTVEGVSTAIRTGTTSNNYRIMER